MKFSATDLQQNIAVEPYLFEGKVDVFSFVKDANQDVRNMDPVFIKGMCTMDDKDLIFSFQIEGNVTLPCARSLVDVVYPFHYDVTEIFTTNHIEEDEEDEIHPIEHDEIDLTPLIAENIVLRMPYRVFSNEKITEEGEGWNFFLEEEHNEIEKNKIDPRLEKLKDLFPNDDE